MRLCLYSPSLGEVVAGGAETFGREIARRLSRRHEVHVVCGGTVAPELAAIEDITFHTFPYVRRNSAPADAFRSLTRYHLDAFWLESVSFFPAAKRHFAENEYDLVAVLYPPDAMVRSVAKGKLAVHFQGYPVGSIKRRIYKRILDRYDPEVSASCSRFVAERVRESLGIESAVVYNGVDTKRFSPGKRDTELTEAFLLEGRRAVLFVGRYSNQKGADTLLRAVARMPDDTVLLMAGGGPLEERLRVLTKELGIEERTRFLGVVAHHELPRLYRAADVVAVPSNMEPLGIVCLEAMACGAPVVASDVGGLPELVGDDAGLLIEPGDPDGLAQGLTTVLEDGKLARRMGAAGRKRAEKMDWDTISAQVEDLYVTGLKG